MSMYYHVSISSSSFLPLLLSYFVTQFTGCWLLENPLQETCNYFLLAQNKGGVFEGGKKWGRVGAMYKMVDHSDFPKS